MSICAHIFVLVQRPLTRVEIRDLERLIASRTGNKSALELPDEALGRYFPVDDADLWADVSENGTLNFLQSPRHAVLLGETSIQGRLLHKNTMTRMWTKEHPQGPAAQHALEVLTLLSLPGVKWAWLVGDDYEGQSPAATMLGMHQLIHDFVEAETRRPSSTSAGESRD